MLTSLKSFNLQAIALTFFVATILSIAVSALNFYVTNYSPVARGALEEIVRFSFVYFVFRFWNLIFLPSVMTSISEVILSFSLGYILFGPYSGGGDIYYNTKFAIYSLTYVAFGVFSGVVYLKQRSEHKDLIQGLTVLVILKICLYFTWDRIENYSISADYALIFMVATLAFFVVVAYLLYRRTLTSSS